MAPFHPLRYEARALAARVLAACAVFCAIAILLLAGSATGPAEARDRDGREQSGEHRWSQSHDDDGDDGYDVAPQGHRDDGDDDDDEDWDRGGGGKWDPPDPETPAGAAHEPHSDPRTRAGARPGRR